MTTSIPAETKSPPHRSRAADKVVSNTYLNAWTCEKYWYYSYAMPIDLGGGKTGEGITSIHNSAGLLTGGVTHKGIEAWYRSGVRDGEDTGERSIEQAMEAAHVAFKRALSRYGLDDDTEAEWNMIEQMLRGYHDYYGPNAPSPEFPETRVACDIVGEPLIEREFYTKISDSYTLMVRPDLLVYKRGYLQIRDHKTSNPYYVGQALKGWRTNPQASSEALVLAQEFPDEKIHGVEVNILVKNTAAKPKYGIDGCAERETTTRSPDQLKQFARDCASECVSIEHKVHDHGLEDPNNFVMQGVRTGQCEKYRGCEFRPLCHEQADLGNYRPKQIIEASPDA